MKGKSAVRLGDVATFIRGINFKPEDVVPLDTPGTVACMRTKNVQAQLDCSDVWAVGKEFVRRDEQYLQVGDVLVSSANSWNLVGKCCWVPELPWPASFGGFISVLRASSDRIEPRYLYWWFASDRTQALLRSFGQKTTNISNLNLKRCLTLELPLPTLGEQRRIVEVLDRADAVRAKRLACIARLDALAQEIFFERFGDPIQNKRGLPVRRMIDLVDPDRPISYGILMPGPDQTDGVKYVRVVDMKDGGVDVTSVRRTTPAISAAFRRSLLKPGDILMSIRGHVGRLAIVPSELSEANITQDTARLAVRDASAVYVRECLRTESLQRWMSRHTKGVAVRGINLTDVKLIPIPVPPPSEQEKFAHDVAVIDRLRAAQRASLEQLDDLYDSVQHRAFSGEL